MSKKIIPLDAARMLRDALKVFPNLACHGISWRKEKLEPPSLEEILVAANWLRDAKRNKNINRNHSSYGLKHLLPDDEYVTNGAFIAACVGLGFECESTDHNSPNVFINISSRWVKEAHIAKYGQSSYYAKR